jgi:uncharacterized protein DUF1629
MGINVKSKLLIWTDKPVKNACSLYKLTGVTKEYQFRKGISKAGTFGDEAAFNMNPDRPNDTLLTDNLFNNYMLIVGSGRLREFFESRAAPKVEYLPVAIIDHKGKVASKEYSIIHPLDPVDCIDQAASQVRWHEFDKNAIDGVKRLVIDESKVEPERVLFRLKFFYWATLIRREVAELIDAAGFTGIQWVDPLEFSR